MRSLLSTMESQKLTSGDAGRGRWYDDACGSAHGLELVGERWSLLVVRELIFGPRRFGALRKALPGISANVLTQRLEGLEAAGVLARRQLPPPASVAVYELTAWGYEAEPVLMELGRWAARSPGHDPALPISAVSVMLSFRTMFSAQRAGKMAATLAFRLGEDAFVVHIEAGSLQVRRGEAADAGVRAAGWPESLAAVVYGGAPPEAAGLAIDGDRALLARFATLFPLPRKAEPA